MSLRVKFGDVFLLDKLDMNERRLVGEFVCEHVELEGVCEVWRWEVSGIPVLGLELDGERWFLDVRDVVKSLGGVVLSGGHFRSVCGSGMCVAAIHLELVDGESVSVGLGEVEVSEAFWEACVVPFGFDDGSLDALEKLIAAGEEAANSSQIGKLKRGFRSRRGRKRLCPDGLLLCDRCKECLPPHRFALNRASSTGRQKMCRDCRREYDRLRRMRKR